MHFADWQGARLGAIEDKVLDAAAVAQDKALDAAATVAAREERWQDGVQAPGSSAASPRPQIPGRCSAASRGSTAR